MISEWADAILVGDIDGNGKVDILDLVKVASQFGQVGENLLGDVNNDNEVDIRDLVRVASNFGKNNAGAAPEQLVSQMVFTNEQKHSIQSAIVELEGMLFRSKIEELVFDF